MNLPHPIPYQGSKRILARFILEYFPNEVDTLIEPFDQLFTRASRTLGSKCKYLVSCGFSFGDKHINDQLLFPKLKAGDIRLVALCGIEPDCISELKVFPSFHAGFPTTCFIDQKDTDTGTDLWKFSELVKLLTP